MDELVQFLRDRLDEDERIARTASEDVDHGDRWEAELYGDDPEKQDAWGRLPFEEDPTPWVCVRHAARHDPARILADVEAKRRAVDECAYWNEKLAQAAANPNARPYPCLGEILDAVNPILRALALPYVDHPDCKPEWRP